MAFVFAFQKVLELKENEKEQIRGKVAEILALLRQKEQDLSVLHGQKEQWEEKLLHRAQGAVNVASLLEVSRYIDYLSVLIHSKEQEIFSTRDQMTRIQGLYTDKAKEIQTWEKLKETRFEEYRQEQASLEQKVMDEIGLQRYWGRERERDGGDRSGGTKIQ